jgi:hypothetical protein
VRAASGACYDPPKRPRPTLVDALIEDAFGALPEQPSWEAFSPPEVLDGFADTSTSS